MKNEYLLKPRIKVIADYPGCPFELNQVLEIELPKTGERLYMWPESDGIIEFSDEEQFKKYPHLFKPLEWWEERDEKDMPEYVKYKYEGKTVVIKIDKFKVNRFGETLGLTPTTLTGRIYLRHANAMPATREEYEQFNQTA